jgi:hypothetical protein
LIRHAGLRDAAFRLSSFAVLALPVAMIEASFRALLVPPVSAPPLTPACQFAAFVAAIEKGCVTLMTQADPLPQNCFVMNLRHASWQAGLDNGEPSWQVRTSSVWFHLTKVTEPGTLSL